MKVSIITSCYNREATVCGAIESVLAQDYPDIEYIVVEDGAWVGAKAVVTAGVTVATHSVLTVGSVVTKNTEPYGIYQGNPAKKVKERVIDA